MISMLLTSDLSEHDRRPPYETIDLILILAEIDKQESGLLGWVGVSNSAMNFRFWIMISSITRSTACASSAIGIKFFLGMDVKNQIHQLYCFGSNKLWYKIRYLVHQ